MQEELEVRLEERNFPISQWNSGYDEKKNAASDISPDCSSLNKDGANSLPSYTSQVKLELEVTLTPEDDNSVTSTVGSMKRDETSKSTSVMTVIPPTTIVCLPSAITNSTIANQMPLNPASSIVSSSLQRTAIVASSSSVPYLSLGTSAPIRAVTQRPKSKTNKDQSSNGTSNRNRTNNKPPPGAVNLERSYQICQAVIQNSPNRHQLRCQLKPPPSSFLNNISNNNNNHAKKIENRATQYGTVTSSRNINLQKTFSGQG